MKKYTLLCLILGIAGLLTARTGICGSYASNIHTAANDHTALVSDTSSSLKIGDRVPDLTFTNLVNYNGKSLKLSDFKNKVIVLDFWATWCSSCLSKFPGERDLQNKLPDKLKILLVDSKATRDTRDKVGRFFEERKHIYDFTSIVADTILTKLFPNNGLPHYVWIKNNIVIAIPGAEELTESNIDAVYDNKPVRITSIKPVAYDFRAELFKNGNGGGATRIIYHSLLAAYKPGLNPSFGLESDSAGNCIRVDALNQSRMDMILLSAPFRGLNRHRILKRVSDPVAFTSDSASVNWRNHNCFNYEATFSPRDQNSARRLMREDIERYFKIRIDSVARDTGCLVITLADTSEIIHGKRGMHGETNIWDHLNTPVFFHDMSLPSIAGLLEEQYKIPVIDATGYHKRVMLELPPDLGNLAAVAESFNRQGFRFTRAKRKINFLQISDQPVLINKK